MKLSRSSKELTFLLVMLLGSRIVLSLATSYTADDAFITYRYAANLAEGRGFVYNEGEKVQGTSSPLYAILLAGIASVFSSNVLPSASRVVSLLADAASMILLWHLLGSFTVPARFATILFFALYPKVVLIGISGMESSFLITLMLASLYFVSCENQYGLLLSFGLLLVCRIDAIIWVFVCMMWVLWKRSRISFGALSVGVFVAATWFVFAWSYFGTWIPHTVIAKRVSWAHMFLAFDPVRVLVGYFPYKGLQEWPEIWKLAASVFMIAPIIISFLPKFRRNDFLVLFPFFFLFYNLVFSFGKIVMADWYYLPGYLAYFVTLGALLNTFIERYYQALSTGRGLFFMEAVGVVFLIALLSISAMRWSKNIGDLFVRQNSLGIWFKNNASHSAHVLLEPIGYVGWASHLYIDDYIGLVSPDVVRYRLRYLNSDAWFLQYLTDQKPDYVVLRNWELPSNQLFHGHGDGIFRNDFEKEWFGSTYHEVIWNPQAARHDSIYLVLYERTKTPYLAQEYLP